jgi:hypothetical protein
MGNAAYAPPPLKLPLIGATLSPAPEARLLIASNKHKKSTAYQSCTPTILMPFGITLFSIYQEKGIISPSPETYKQFAAKALTYFTAQGGLNRLSQMDGLTA